MIGARDRHDAKRPLVPGTMTTIDRRFVVLSCPYYLTHKSPAVAWVAEAYEWREVGGLQYDALPVFARRAVTSFARGVSRRQAREMERSREEAERKSARAKR
jgi:hypothetical protein